jgi:hypothetical protein
MKTESTTESDVTGEAPPLDFEQRQRANLIMESRGIDDETALELVYLRDAVKAYDEALAESEKKIFQLIAQRDDALNLVADLESALRSIIDLAHPKDIHAVGRDCSGCIATRALVKGEKK